MENTDEGYVFSSLTVSSYVWTAHEIFSHLSPADYLQEKGELMGNQKTRFESSNWIKHFEKVEGDSFGESLLAVKKFCEDVESELESLKLKDPRLSLHAELIFNMGSYHFGGILDPQVVAYLEGMGVSFCLSIYPN